MTDHFASLGAPRRPWLDEDSLHARFLSLSAGAHPDRVHGAGEVERSAAQQQFTELNAAFQCLREPRTRVRHLLELELGKKPADLHAVDASLMDLFGAVGELCRAADVLIREQQVAVSPLVRVGLFQRSQEWLEKNGGMQQRIQSRREEVLARLKALDREWDSEFSAPVGLPRRPLPLAELEEIYRLLGFYDRWGEQLRKKAAHLHS